MIPTFNEEESIARVLDSVETAMKAEAIDYEMIIVDNGSSDKTLEIARSRDVKIVRHDQNKGYGPRSSQKSRRLGIQTLRKALVTARNEALQKPH